MSILFGNIMSAIFNLGAGKPQPTPAGGAAPGPTPSTSSVGPASTVLTKLASQNKEKLDGSKNLASWRGF